MSAIRAGSIRANVTVTWTTLLNDDAVDEQMNDLEQQVRDVLLERLRVMPQVTVKPFRPVVAQ